MNVITNKDGAVALPITISYTPNPRHLIFVAGQWFDIDSNDTIQIIETSEGKRQTFVPGHGWVIE